MEGQLSQSPKKPGARDISDLKARLGLKKGGPGTPEGARTPGGSVPPPMGGASAVLPPGAQPSVPAPPGAQPPAPDRPPLPDVKQDPFAAMNAMAAPSARARPAAPEYIVVNDGEPVERVGSKSGRGAMVTWVGVAAVALFVGVAVGQIGTNASIYNESIADAKLIADTVKQIDGQLQSLRDTLYRAKERGADGQSYLIADEKLSQALAALGLTPPDLTKVYESRLYELDQGLVDQTITFLTEAQLLFKQIKDHQLKTEQEAKAIQVGNEQLRKYGGPARYAVYIDKNKGEGAPLLAQFVEIGDPVCQDGKPNAAGCGGAAPRGFLYRPNELGPWGTMELASPDGAGIRQLLPLGFSPSPALTALFAGGGATVAEAAYTSRMRDIDAKVDDLVDRAKRIQKTLTSTASRGKKFSFFM
jgi:hypothetical protein